MTMLWPGLPWVWLRGSVPGLVVAVAFAVTLDVAVLTTWIWTDLVDLPFRIATWAGVAAIWILGTASAAAAFPPPLPTGYSPSVDTRFEAARNAYLARDWAGAEHRLRALLRDAPTDGEAQLLLGTLLRRVGRLPEAKAALEALARSDDGARWHTAIARELSLLATRLRPGEDGPAVLPLGRPANGLEERTAA